MKIIEKILIWLFLVIAVFLLFKSSDEPLISLLSDTFLEEALYKFELGKLNHIQPMCRLYSELVFLLAGCCDTR